MKNEASMRAHYQRFRRILHHGQIAYHWKIQKSMALPYLPAEIGFELTNRCNFKCAFCPQSSPQHFDQVPRTQLSVEQAELMLAKLRRGGVTGNVMHWTLDGEPFMNKQFAEIVRAAAAHGFNAHHFASNGFFVSPERLAAFPLGVDDRYFITTDFCADPDYFEQYRGTAGSWAVVRQNLTEVLANPKFSSVHFKITDISSYTVRDPQEQQQRFAALQALFAPNPRLTFHQRVFHNMAGFKKVEKKSSHYNLCPYPWISLVVASNGDCVACCRDLEHRTVLGNLLEQELVEIWNGEKYQALRRALAERRPEDIEACKGCDMPSDDSKFSLQNLVKTAVHRALLFEKV